MISGATNGTRAPYEVVGCDTGTLSHRSHHHSRGHFVRGSARGPPCGCRRRPSRRRSPPRPRRSARPAPWSRRGSGSRRAGAAPEALIIGDQNYTGEATASKMSIRQMASRWCDKGSACRYGRLNHPCDTSLISAPLFSLEKVQLGNRPKRSQTLDERQNPPQPPPPLPPPLPLPPQLPPRSESQSKPGPRTPKKQTHIAPQP